MYIDNVDENDKQLGGLKVSLLQNNAVINEGLTPILFKDLPQGTYIVKEILPKDYVSTGPESYEFTIEPEHLFHIFTFGPYYLPEPEFHRNIQIIKGVSNTLMAPSGNREKIPSWNSTGRPTKPNFGLIGFNTQTHSIEVWNGENWLVLIMEKISNK